MKDGMHNYILVLGRDLQYEMNNKIKKGKSIKVRGQVPFQRWNPLSQEVLCWKLPPQPKGRRNQSWQPCYSKFLHFQRNQTLVVAQLGSVVAELPPLEVPGLWHRAWSPSREDAGSLSWNRWLSSQSLWMFSTVVILLYYSFLQCMSRKTGSVLLSMWVTLRTIRIDPKQMLSLNAIYLILVYDHVMSNVLFENIPKYLWSCAWLWLSVWRIEWFTSFRGYWHTPKRIKAKCNSFNDPEAECMGILRRFHLW